MKHDWSIYRQQYYLSIANMYENDASVGISHFRPTESQFIKFVYNEINLVQF